jgi:hypothetical protein
MVRHVVAEGAVDNVGVAGDPTNVGHAGELVVGVDVKDTFDGEHSNEDSVLQAEIMRRRRGGRGRGESVTVENWLYRRPLYLGWGLSAS